MSIFKRLDIEQREAVGLLQVGTFLEYFDLMLYVHMAVLLNELFFPQADPDSAFSFLLSLFVQHLCLGHLVRFCLVTLGIILDVKPLL
jgi:hypothetical protein